MKPLRRQDCREILWDTCEERVLLDAAPVADAGGPAEGMVNEDVSLRVEFDNAGDDTGYGPYVDLVAEQGLDFNDDATYSGASVATRLVGTWDAGDARFEDASGNEVVEHPLTGLPLSGDADLTTGRQDGDAFYALTLPFGSYVPDQPTSTVDFTATLDSAEGAVVGTPLDVQTRGGFMFGDATPLNDPDTDPQVAGAFDKHSITPVVVRLTKTASYAEDEPTTGSNFPVAYTVAVDVANGETISNLTLADLLPDEMSFVSGTPSTGVINGQSLDVNIGSLTGTTSDAEYTLTYSAYVNDVIADDDGDANDDLVLGENVTATYGYEAATGLTATARDDVTAKLIATQKSVSLVSDPGNEGVSAGDTLEWTIRFQVSDHTSASSIVFDDVFTDGLEFDTSFAPTYSVTRNGDAASGTFGASTSAGNFVYDVQSGGADGGKTFVAIDLSQQLIDDNALDGDGVLAGDDFNDPHGQGGTVGTITFRTRILEDFRENFPSGDRSVDAGDVLANNVTVRATVAGGDAEADGSAASVSVVGPTFDKTIYAINGDTDYDDVAVQPGQTVTYRLRGTIPAADVEQLVFGDYLPLPVFDVTDPDADGTPSGWTYNAADGLPAAGEIRFTPQHNLGSLTYAGNSPTNPTSPGFISVDGDANKLELNFGTFDTDGAQTAEIDVLLTVAATDKPFADGLFLTNQAEFTYGDTFANSTTATEIVQIRLDMPELTLTKGVGAINGNDDASIDGTGGDANALDVDAGDIVTMRVEVANSGGGDAFDLALVDLVPAGFETPAGGLNYRVTDGTGATRTDFTGDLLAGTFELTDPGGDASLGSGETLVIEYDLRVADAAEIGSTIGEGIEARITRYGASDGGANFTANNTGDWQDDATATLATPTVDITVTANDPRADTTGTDVVIGELVTYTATITLPEGTTADLNLVDLLQQGLAFKEVVSVTGSADVSFTPETATITKQGNGPINEGRRLTQPIGTVTTSNTGTGGGDDTITIVYTAVVTNRTNSDHNETRKNQAEIDFAGDTLSDAANRPALRLKEPLLEIETIADRSDADAGDLITFTVTVDHAATGRPGAYDLEISELVPANMTYEPGSIQPAAGSVAFDTLSITGSDITATIASLPNDGSVASFTYQARVDTSAVPNTDFDTDGRVEWTSLAGDVTTTQSTHSSLAVERTGDANDPAQNGSANDYADTSSASVNFLAPTAAVTLADTSETFTTGTAVAIGEVVRYQLDVVVPEATLPDSRLLVDLPAGLTQIDDGEVRLTLTSDNAFTTESDLFVSGDVLDASRIIDNGDGTFTLDLGDLTNNDSNDGNAESIRLGFNALVENTTDNAGGDVKAAAFTFRVDGDALATSDPANLAVVEPSVTDVAKSIVGSPGDAGDLFTYRVTFSNTGGTTAHDLRLVDDLDAKLLRTATPVSVVGGSFTPSVVDNGTSTRLDLSIAALPAGESIIVEYQVQLQQAAKPGETIDSQAQLAFSSLPGSGTSPNPTGTATPGGSGDADGERTYADADAASFTVASPTLATAVTTSLSETGAAQHTSLADVAVGELVTFDLTAVVPEGTFDEFVLTHTLPTGLTFVSGEVVDTGGLTNADLDVGDSGSTSGANVVFDFGDNVVNADDNSASNDAVTVRVVARVADIVGNTDAAALASSSVLDWGDGTQSRGDSVEVVEPSPTVSQVRDLAAGDAGDVVTYTVTIANPGTAAGYSTTFTDTLPPNLVLDTDSVTTTAGTITSGETSGDTSVAVDLSTVAAGAGPITISYQARLADAVTPGDELDTDVRLGWSSAPADGRTGGATTSTSVTATGATSLSRTSTSTSLAFTDNADVTLGETFAVEYTLRLPEGTLPQLVVAADLPAGLGELVSAQVVSVGGSITANGTPVLSDTDGDGANDSVTIDFGTDVANTGDNASDGDDEIILRFVGIARDVAANTSGDTLPLSVSVDDGLATVTDTASFALVEPSLNVTQTRSPAAGDAGDEVIFSVVIENNGGTSDAQAIVLTDALDPNLELVVNSVTATAGTVTTGNSAGDTSVRVDLSSLDRTAGPVTVVYRATIADTATPGDELSARADLAYASAPSSGRAYGDSDGTVVDVVGTTSAATAFTTSLATTTGADVVVGEALTLTDTVTLPEGTLPRLVVTRELPATAGIDALHVVSSTLVDSVGGTLSATPVLSDTDGDGVNDRVTLDFGTNVVLRGNNDSNDNTLVLETVVRLADVPDAVNNATLPAPLTVDDGLGGATTQQNFDVVEPTLSIIKTVDKATADIGEVVTFTLTVTHDATSSAAAYETLVTDPVLGGGVDKLDLVEGSATILSGPGSITLGDDAGETTVAVDLETFAPGQTTVIQYQARANGFASALGDTLDNDAIVAWQSAPSDFRSGTAADGAVFATNATGIASLTAAVVETDLAGTLGTDAAVGETVTFEVVGTLPNGSYPQDVVFEFDVPDGLEITGHAVERVGDVVNFASATPGGDENALTLTLADVQVDAGGSGVQNEVAVRVVARVADVPAAARAAVLTADARVVNGGAVLTSNAAVTVAEPQLAVTLTASDPTPHLGDVVTYTIVADPSVGDAEAYYGSLRITLPDGLTHDDASSFTLPLPDLAPTDTPVTLTFDADVTADRAAWSADISPTVEASYASATSLGRSYASALTTPTSIVGPDLSITVDDGDAVRTTGETWTQTATVTNLDHPSGDVAADVLASVTLPDGVAFAGSDDPRFEAIDGDTVTFRIPTLAVGDVESLSFDVRADDVAPVHVDALRFEASVTHADVEPTLGDNAATDVTILDAAPDLVVNVTADTAEAKNDTGVTWTIVVTNQGDQPASGVEVVADVPDESLDLADAQATQWTIPLLGVGETRAFTVETVVKSGIQATIENLVVTATASDDATNGLDREPGDNVAGDSVVLVSEPNLVVAAELLAGDTPADLAPAEEVNPGDAVAYVVTVTNTGGQEATGVTVTAEVPADVLDLLDAADATTDAEAGTITWSLASVPAGETITLELTGEVRFPPPPGVQEFNSSLGVADDGSNGPDRDPSDNQFAFVTGLEAFVFDASFNAATSNATASGSASPTSFVGSDIGGSFGSTSWRSAMPLSIEPLYTGSAAPGSSVNVTVYDDAGRAVGTRTITADAAGAWHASLPSTSYGGAEPVIRAGLQPSGSRLFSGEAIHAASAGVFGMPRASAVSVGSSIQDAPHDLVATADAPAAHLLGQAETRPAFSSPLHGGLSVRRGFTLDVNPGDRVAQDQAALRNPFALAAARDATHRRLAA